MMPIYVACTQHRLKCSLTLPCSKCRCEVVERRARHALQKAEKRLHLVQGFMKAMTDLDQVVKIIRAADDAAAASAQLQQQHGLSAEQAEGVLNLSLRRLTSLEAQKLQEENDKLVDRSVQDPPVLCIVRQSEGIKVLTVL